MGIVKLIEAFFGLQWQILLLILISFWIFITFTTFRTKRGSRLWQGFTILFLPSFISGIIVTIIYQSKTGSITLASMVGGLFAILTGFTFNKIITFTDALNKWFTR